MSDDNAIVNDAPTDAPEVARVDDGGAGIMEREGQHVEAAITAALVALGYAPRRVDLRPIPFEGTLGVASSVCKAVAGEATERELALSGALDDLSKKERKRLVAEAVPSRAQSLAEGVAAQMGAGTGNGFARVEAVNGYVNVYFDAIAVAARLIGEVLTAGVDYGKGAPQTELVMIEHSQLNTHKAAHVGHLRNICLGVALTNILAAAGYRTMPATYIGDIGMHVVKCLWCYERFHDGQEPVDLAGRGRWLGEVYAEADARLNHRKDVLDFLYLLAKEDIVFVAAIDRLLKYLWRKRTEDKDMGEDVAYLLGRFTHAQEIKEEMLRREDVIPRFWPIVGDQLRDEVINQKPYVPVDGQPEPTMTPEERLTRWEELDRHLVDWWPYVPFWRDEVKETFQRWERKDPVFVRLWEETRAWSMADLGRIFDEMGARFDVWFSESEVEEPGRQMVRELLDRGIAEISDGLPVVKIDERLGLETETFRTLPILRSDGTTLYATKDLALTKLKFEQYAVDRALWVVDVGQALYFQQISKILELAGFEQAQNAIYVGYEYVTLPEGVISSRKGNAPLAEDVRDAVLARARAIIEEKNPSLPAATKERVAWEVGIGALKYGMLARDNNKVVVFVLEEVLSFDGHAAPYIQYAHARACRILEHAGLTDDALREALVTYRAAPRAAPTDSEPMPEELTLLREIAALPDEIARAAAECRPLLITSYVYELAKRFNDFYHACPVLQSPEPTRTVRLALVAATRQTLANSLALLGIAAPVEM